jgi:hypothetical protein
MNFDEKELDLLLKNIEKIAGTIVIVATAAKTIYDLYNSTFNKDNKKE